MSDDAVQLDAEGEPPVKLGPRGRELWDELRTGVELRGAAGALAIECCRIVDRLDRLDGALRSRGHDWLSLAEEVEQVAAEHGAIEVRVVVDGVLSEARQQANALRQAVQTLGLATLTARESATADGIDDVAARRAARRAASASA